MRNIKKRAKNGSQSQISTKEIITNIGIIVILLVFYFALEFLLYRLKYM